mgnify:CR=1 FL=1
MLGPPTPWGQAGKVWSDLVKERTQGRINMKLYPGGSLIQGDQTREFSALRQGVIDMAIGSTINWSPQVKQLNLFSLPFLMPDYAAADALTQGDVGKSLFQTLDKAGVVPLAWGENGYREISNSKKAIKSPDDLKGMKIRVVGSPLFLDTFTALGANPTQMSWADAQPAMASSAVDGQENPLPYWDNFGRKFTDGLMFLVASLIYNIFIVLALGAFGVMASLVDPRGAEVILSLLACVLVTAGLRVLALWRNWQLPAWRV